MQPKQIPEPKIRYVALFAVAIIGVGVAFYQWVEKLSFVDALYFSVITLTTVGYGDITPQTDAGKLFTVVYVLFGIAIIVATTNYIVRRALLPKIKHMHERHHQHHAEHPHKTNKDT